MSVGLAFPAAETTARSWGHCGGREPARLDSANGIAPDEDRNQEPHVSFLPRLQNSAKETVSQWLKGNWVRSRAADSLFSAPRTGGRVLSASRSVVPAGSAGGGSGEGLGRRAPTLSSCNLPSLPGRGATYSIVGQPLHKSPLLTKLIHTKVRVTDSSLSCVERTGIKGRGM